MTDAILVLNIGSSSIKFKIFGEADDLPIVVEGKVIDIGDDPLLVVHHDKFTSTEAVKPVGHVDILEFLLSWLDSYHGDLKINAIGHRIVHGGREFPRPVILTDSILGKLRGLSPLAPLHQPLCLGGVDIARRWKPDACHVGCFDTSFHSGHAAIFDTYPLPQVMRDQGVKRYGFHGLSYESIMHTMGNDYPELAEKRIVVAHLGSGASLCALHQKKSVDTTMGMTALEGLPMSTRCGALDPGVVLYMIKELGLTCEQAEYTLYQQSGLKALSGTTGNVEDLSYQSDSYAKFAIEYFCLKTAQFIGMMAASLQGIDAIVFTGGIGENNADIRTKILQRLNFLMPFDTLVIPTDEERMIAMHVLEKQEISHA